MSYKTRQTWSVILSIAGTIGTVVTAILSAKATKKAVEKVNYIVKKPKLGVRTLVVTPTQVGYQDFVEYISNDIDAARIASYCINSRDNKIGLTVVANDTIDISFDDYKPRIVPGKDGKTSEYFYTVLITEHSRDRGKFIKELNAGDALVITKFFGDGTLDNPYWVEFSLITDSLNPNCDEVNISKKEMFRQIAPLYIPTVVVGLLTITSTVSSIILSRKTEASLAAVALLADQGWRRYKNTAKDVLGLDKHVDILKEIGKGELKKNPIIIGKKDTRKLYHEEHVGFFHADPEKLALSYGDLNQRLAIEDFGTSSYYAMIYDFLEQAEAELVDDRLPEKELSWGWSQEYLYDAYAYVWIHMSMHEVKADDGTVYTEIEWGEEPILDPGNHGEAFIDRDPDDEENRFLPVNNFKGVKLNG